MENNEINPAPIVPNKRTIDQAKKITKLATTLLHNEKLKAAVAKAGVIHVHMEDAVGFNVTISLENTPKP